MCGKVKPVTNKEIVLRECPFCGESLDLELHVYDGDDLPSVVGVYCAVCGAEGPAHLSENEALNSWNVRVGDGDD